MTQFKYILVAVLILLVVGSQQVYQRGYFTFFDLERIERISAKEAEILISEKPAIVLDVRNPDEFETSHVQGAIRYSPEEIDRLNKAQPVLVYCTVGFRSNEAAKELRKKGFEEIYELRDGLIGWANSGLPVVDHANEVTAAIHVYHPAFQLFLKNGEAVY